VNPFLRGLLYSGGMTARSSARGPNSDSDDSGASASDDIREATRALNEAITAFSRAVGAAGQGGVGVISVAAGGSRALLAAACHELPGVHEKGFGLWERLSSGFGRLVGIG